MTTRIEREHSRAPLGARWVLDAESRGCTNHKHDRVRELSRTSDAPRRCDQLIASAEIRSGLQACRREFTRQGIERVAGLKQALRSESQQSCF